MTTASGPGAAARRAGRHAVPAGAALFGGLLMALPAPAIEFGGGGLQGSLDTTISHGMTFRAEGRDKALASGANDNDGNLNYDRGLVSNTSKFTADLEVQAGDFGAFVRATGFIDFENDDGKRERTRLGGAAKKRVGSDFDVLDAYVTGAFDAGGAIVDMRLGKHVLNWGESTFIPNGINAINPFDVSKLRLPGSELREALLPVGLASASVAPTGKLSVEGFYQFDWDETEIDPVGSYFSTTDYVGPGANRAVIALPELEPLGLGDTGITATNNPFAAFGLPDIFGENPDFLTARRGPDHAPGNSGQWGLALRYFAEEFNDTEFGFYYMNHHSRLPVVSARTGTAESAGAGLAAAGRVAAAASAAVPLIIAAGRTPEEAQGLAEGAAAAAGIDAYARTGHYFVEYPEDIRLFGVSFNTELGATGWALQGEWSHRRDAPLQLAERKVFAEALAPVTECLARAGANPADGPACIGEKTLAGLYDTDTTGYVRRNVSQVQATATRVFGPTMGADSLAFVAEAAVMRVHGMPKGKGVTDDAALLAPGVMPLDSPAGGKLGPGKGDADATSWGYRVAARLDYNNAVRGVNLFPYAQFLHDVSGNSPAPSGPFVEGRTALTLGLKADYLSSWEADLSYTRMAGKGNELSDRDFISVSFKYSF